MSGFKRLGRYDIVGQLGRGSFGVVYHGQDPLMKKDVAIKVCTLEDPSLRQRFTREAEISRQLEHENIVSVQAFAEENGVPFLVQEFLRGEDLREVIRRREPWSVVQRLDILLQIGRGLAYAHTRGIIHRDIKPANIRVLPDLRAKIMDFGIAKLANDESQLTQKGVTMGTASYLPPEQVRGGEVSHRADIFSLGVLAYELLCYQRPFRGKTISALVYQILYKSPDPLSTVWSTCPPELSDLIGRCLEKDAGKRCPDMDTVVGKLMEIRQGVLDGRWPALAAPAGPPSGFHAEDEPSTSGSILSQSLIARTAKDVTREVASADIKAAKATQPMGAVAAETQRITAQQPTPKLPTTPTTPPASRPPAASPPPVPTPVPAPQDSTFVVGTDGGLDTAVTQRVVMGSGVVEVPGSQGTATGFDAEEIPTVVGTAAAPEVLESSAEEISKLVASGDLQAAMSQLEQTIQQRDHTSGLPTTPPPSPLPSAPQTAVNPDLPTIQLEHARAPTTPQRANPAAPQPAPSPATRPKSATGSSRNLLVGVGVAILLALAAGLGLWLGGKSEPEAPPPPVLPPEATVIETPASSIPRSGVVVLASPWAEVLEVTDSSGSLVDLPPAATTPVFLPLLEGQYRVTLNFPQADKPDEQERICEVEVPAETIVTCNERLREPRPLDFFKNNGWWR